MLALHVVGSGSKGNCAIVEDAESGRGVLVDCGICRRDVLGFAREAGFAPERIEAVLITHDHSDHVSKAGVVLRALAREGMPVHVLPEVRAAASGLEELSGLADFVDMACGRAFEAAGIAVVPYRTSHDAAASCGFRFESADGDALGFATDTGCATEAMLRALSGVRILALEANHDERMLAEGPYPRFLQERIRSDAGHLSNAQAAAVLRQVASQRLEKVVAMHLSEHNNLPSLARAALEEALAQAGVGAEVHVASQRRLVSVR